MIDLRIPELPEGGGRTVVLERDDTVRVDSRAWLQFVRKERSLASLLVTGKLRLKGSPKLLAASGKCFP